MRFDWRYEKRFLRWNANTMMRQIFLSETLGSVLKTSSRSQPESASLADTNQDGMNEGMADVTVPDEPGPLNSVSRSGIVR